MRNKLSTVTLVGLLLIGSTFVLFGNMTQSASAQTNFTKYPTNPRLTVGTGGQWDSDSVEVAAVINDGGIYKMWYHGLDVSGNYRIGYATSPDGVLWTKYASNPVLDLGGPGEWDSDAVMTPTVIKDGATYRMWFSGFDGSTYQIGYATSPDGTTWTKYAGNPVVTNGAPGDWDEVVAYLPTVIYDGVTYEMWYTGFNMMFNIGIGYATSPDGTTWLKYASNPVLTPGAPAEWDETVVLSGANSVYYDGGTGTYMFWYTGVDSTFLMRIGYATSPDGTTWAKYPSNPVLDVGAGGDWDESGVAFPTAFLDGGTYKMWYTGIDSSGAGHIGYAYELSDAPPTIEAWEPGGTSGQTHTQGDLITVTWTATDDNVLPPNPINISYGAGALWTTISNGEVNDGVYVWDTSSVPCPGTYWMNLSVYDSIGQTTFDESNYSFTIFCPGDNPPIMTVYEPGGTLGQTYVQGDLIGITWLAIDDNPLPPTPINLTYGTPGSWTIIMVNEPNTGSFNWDTSSVPCPGTYWMNLTVYDSIGQESYDWSNFSFDILCPGDNPPTIEAWEPGGTMGQAYFQGDMITVTWFAIDDNPLPPNPINITYGDSIGGWTPIASLEANDLQYDWNTSAVPCPAIYWMNLSVYDSIGQTTFDESNYSFLILCPDPPPMVEVWEPGGTPGQTYIQGDIIDITWIADDNFPWPNGGNVVNISYGVSPLWISIMNHTLEDGIYNWDTSAVPCPGTYWINISVYDSIGQTTFDESNYSFDIQCPIDMPPTIEAWEPGGTSGQTHIQGDLIDIIWTANDDNPWPNGGNVVNISYGINPFWISIMNYTLEDGIYIWDTLAVPCPGIYWVNISVYDSIGQMTFDESNYSFEILCPGDNPPTLEVWEPGGASSQIYIQGDLIDITWTANDDNPWPNGGNIVNISYGLMAAGGTPIANNEFEDGIYPSWDTSSVACPNAYWINISVYDSIGQWALDNSNYSFTILCPDTSPTLEVWEPGGTPGQTYIQGDLINITWTANDDNPWPNGGNVVNISYGLTPAGGTPIANNEFEDGIYPSWDTSSVACPFSYWINISVYDSIGQSMYNNSNYSFDILCPGDNPPIIEVWEPGGTSGQTYTEGDTIMVMWNATDDNPLPASPINITFGNAGSWTSIANNQANDGSYSWDTSGVSCPGTYLMNISVRDSIGQTTSDFSNNSFTINCAAVNEGDVSGKVVDENDNPIAGATVILKDDSGATVSTKTTGSTGTYTFQDVDFGQYTIEVSAPGYATATTSQFTVNGDESLPDITMTATQPPQPPITDWLSEWWWLIVLIVAIIIVVILLAILLARRKKPEPVAIPPEEEAPQQQIPKPPQAPPIAPQPQPPTVPPPEPGAPPPPPPPPPPAP